MWWRGYLRSLPSCVRNIDYSFSVCHVCFVTSSTIYVSKYLSSSCSRSIRNSAGRITKRLRFKLTLVLQFRTYKSFFILILESNSNFIPDLISMTVRATYFHPDVITFRWFCQGGELSPVASQASSSPLPNSEGFFSAYSQCKLPRSELEKGSTKVWVSVHHIALKQPITRETRGQKKDAKNQTSSGNTLEKNKLTKARFFL